MAKEHFKDEKKTLPDFYGEVWVVCPSCQKRAVAKVNVEKQEVRLICQYCGFHKQKQTRVHFLGDDVEVRTSADFYFDSELWLQAPFKKDRFFAYNLEHLEYLERYISASLREHKDRTGFTLLEKLPKFYHEAKNRDSLLKIIERLKEK